jgi:hypothetical protein
MRSQPSENNGIPGSPIQVVERQSLFSTDSALLLYKFDSSIGKGF